MLNVYIFFLKIFIYSYTVPSPRIPNSRQYDAACRVDVPNWKYNDSRCRFGNETLILPFHQHKFGVKLVLKQLKINFIKVSLTGFIYLYTVQTPYISLQLNIQEEKRVYICICTFQEHRLCRVFFFSSFFSKLFGDIHNYSIFDVEYHKCKQQTCCKSETMQKGTCSCRRWRSTWGIKDTLGTTGERSL